MPQPITLKKDCDQDCIGPECSDFFCHDGEANGTHLVKCESCGRPFCMAHVKEYELSIFMCDPCALADRTSFPISTTEAWKLFEEFKTEFEFIDSFTNRKAWMTPASGIIYEGGSI